MVFWSCCAWAVAARASGRRIQSLERRVFFMVSVEGPMNPIPIHGTGHSSDRPPLTPGVAGGSEGSKPYAIWGKTRRPRLAAPRPGGQAAGPGAAAAARLLHLVDLDQGNARVPAFTRHLGGVGPRWQRHEEGAVVAG